MAVGSQRLGAVQARAGALEAVESASGLQEGGVGEVDIRPVGSLQEQ